MGHDFFFELFFFGRGYKNKKKIYKKKSGNWDLISFPHRSFFIRFTDVYTHFHVKISTL